MARRADRPIYLQRVGERLLPVSQIDAEAMHELPAGRPLVAWIKRPSKSTQQLRLYWAVLDRALQARPDPRWPTARSLADTLLVETGFRRFVVRLDGAIEIAPASIAAMTHDEFHRHFEAAMPLIREHVLGCSRVEFDLFLADIADVIGIGRDELVEVCAW